MSPVLTASPQNTSNCVFFLRDDLGVHLPYGLSDWNGKKDLVNSSIIPQKGDVAIIPYKDSTGVEIGHVALVTNVTPTSITIVEANFRTNPATGQGRVTSRIATGADLGDAAKELNIYGFYRPSSQ
jgi:CHAP domain